MGLSGNDIFTQYMVVTSKESQDILWEICYFPTAPSFSAPERRRLAQENPEEYLNAMGQN